MTCRFQTYVYICICIFFFLCCSNHLYPYLEDLRKDADESLFTVWCLNRRAPAALEVWAPNTHVLKVPENVPRLWLLDQGTDHIFAYKFPHSLKLGGCLKMCLLEIIPGIFELPSWLWKFFERVLDGIVQKCARTCSDSFGNASIRKRAE